jgi:hypothetical protein
MRDLGRDLPPGVRVASWELVADGVIVHGDAFIDEYVLGLRAAIRAQEATEDAGLPLPEQVPEMPAVRAPFPVRALLVAERDRLEAEHGVRGLSLAAVARRVIEVALEEREDP